MSVLCEILEEEKCRGVREEHDSRGEGEVQRSKGGRSAEVPLG